MIGYHTEMIHLVRAVIRFKPTIRIRARDTQFPFTSKFGFALRWVKKQKDWRIALTACNAKVPFDGI